MACRLARQRSTNANRRPRPSRSRCSRTKRSPSGACQVPPDRRWPLTLDRDETYRINTTSYYFTTFALLPLLAAAKMEGGAAEPGNVVNISSISGLTPTSQRGQFNYNASKWVL